MHMRLKLRILQNVLKTHKNAYARGSLLSWRRGHWPWNRGGWAPLAGPGPPTPCCCWTPLQALHPLPAAPQTAGRYSSNHDAHVVIMGTNHS